MPRSKGIPNSPPTDLIVVARIVGGYGIKGWIKLAPESIPSNSVLLHTRNWWLKAAGADCVPVSVVQARSQGNSVVAQLEGVTDRDQAEALRSQSILVGRSEFPPTLENEYYWIDLIGCVVENAAGLSLGEVEDLVDHGAHSILVVRPLASSGAVDQEQILIPFVAQFLLDVDLQGRKIRVDWQSDY